MDGVNTFQNELKHEIEESGCCFCFRREDLFSLLDSYDTDDNYAAMITDCFQIDMKTSNEMFHKNLYVICKLCILRLKDAFRFRTDVQNGLKRIQNLISEVQNNKVQRCTTNEFDINLDFSSKAESECSVLSFKEEHNKKDNVNTFDNSDDSSIIYDVPLMCKVEMDCENETDANEDVNRISECSNKIENKRPLNDMKGMNSEQYQRFLESLRRSKSKSVIKTKKVRPVKKKNSNEYIPTLNRDLNLSTLAGMVSDEKTAVEFFQICGIIPQRKICDNGHEMCISFSDTAPLWRCQRKNCRIKRGIRQNTWLQKSRITLKVAVQFIYYWSKEMTSVKFCAKQFGISQLSVVDWNNHLREVCVWRTSQCGSQIGGEGFHVDIDETAFNNPENNAGKKIVPQWIFAGICRETKDCFIVPVSGISVDYLYPVIVEMIKPGSVIISNNWLAFDKLLNSTMQQYKFASPESVERTRDIESLWISAKLSNKKRMGTNKNYLKSYIAELVWKLKLGRKDPFEQILCDIVAFWEANRDRVK